MDAFSRPDAAPHEHARDRARLDQLRTPLLRLHKALLDSERVTYERENGRVESSGALLQLVINDPWFAWLRPLSAMIVAIDERLADKEATSAADIRALLAQIRAFVEPGSRTDDAGSRYQAAFQRDPSVVLAHGDVIRSLQR